MAEKDVTEKILMSYADVFADCINTLVYDGERQLDPDDTQPAPTESFYKAGKAHNQFCDASRYLTEKGTIVLQYIIENETELEERQVLRKISYQGGFYRRQLESGVPVMFGVLATENIEQAIERAGTKAGNKGADCALSAIEMVDLIRSLED